MCIVPIVLSVRRLVTISATNWRSGVPVSRAKICLITEQQSPGQSPPLLI